MSLELFQRTSKVLPLLEKRSCIFSLYFIGFPFLMKCLLTGLWYTTKVLERHSSILADPQVPFPLSPYIQGAPTLLPVAQTHHLMSSLCAFNHAFTSAGKLALTPSSAFSVSFEALLAISLGMSFLLWSYGGHKLYFVYKFLLIPHNFFSQVIPVLFCLWKLREALPGFWPMWSLPLSGRPEMFSPLHFLEVLG